MVDKKKDTTKKKAPARKAPAKPAAKAAAKPTAKVARQRRTPAEKAPAPARAKARAELPELPRATGVQDLRPSSGATRPRKRIGRGPGSGQGKTAGRGHKGQKSRSGYHHQRGFEGGQMPLHRRVPKRGFTNIFRREYDVVNLSDLDRFEAGDSVTPQELARKRLAHGRRPVKILGGGELKKALTVSAHKFSESARTRIEAAGGKCEVLTTSS